jgi:fluoride exporter
MSEESAEYAKQFLFVGAGGAIGAVGRYALLQWLGTVDDGYLPWGTVTANIAGSLLLGLVVGLAERQSIGRMARLFLAVGLFGGFTTFSFFSYENLELLRDNRFAALLVNITLQVTAGLLGAAIGYFAVWRYFGR